MPQVADLDNLLVAFWKARRAKDGKNEVQAFSADLDHELAAMRAGLLAGDIAVGDHRFFTIHDPKKRRICAASFRERVLHHALMNVCEPVLERYAIADSYACRPGKGLHRAIDRAQQFSRRWPFCLKLDVAGYFDHIDHATVSTLLARRIKDQPLLGIFRRIVDSYEVSRGAGLPIGHLTSQHLANLYLGAYDHQVKECWRIRGYLRYMDDMLLFGDRSQLRQALRVSREYLGTELSLALKPEAVLRRVTEGIEFLGFRVFPDRILLARRSRRRYAHRLAALERAHAAGLLGEADLQRRVAAMASFVSVADSRGFRRAIHGLRDSLFAGRC